jgi:Fe2+ transport system protein FeoA
MYLRDMRIGEKGRITKVGMGEKCYRQKLLAMGLVPGTEFQIARIAPLGDPIEIAVRGYALSLRGDEASILQVEKV